MNDQSRQCNWLNPYPGIQLLDQWILPQSQQIYQQPLHEDLVPKLVLSEVLLQDLHELQMDYGKRQKKAGLRQINMDSGKATERENTTLSFATLVPQCTKQFVSPTLA